MLFRSVVKDEPDGAMVGRLRGSVLLLGPLLARRGRAKLAPPGGDFPARRTISTHLEALVFLLAEGPKTLWELAKSLTWNRPWSELDQMMHRAAVNETAAHLRHLTRRGHAARLKGVRPITFEAVAR